MNKLKKSLAIILIIAVTLSMVSCNPSADVDIPENTTGVHEHETSEEVTLPESTEGEESSSVQTESVEETESIETESQTSVPEEETTEPEESTETEETMENSAESSEEEPTEESTEISTEASTEAPTEAPTQAPTEAPTQAPTQAPTEAPTEHQHVYTSMEVAATCVLDGYTIYICPCSDSYNLNYVKAKGHNWSEWVTIVAPTETSTGYAERTCDQCGAKQSKTLSKVVAEHTHNHIVVHAAEATCMAEGMIIYRCACGNEYTEYVAKSDHSYSDKVTVYEPTCTMDGYTEHRCKHCGKTYRDTIVATPGHLYQVIEEITPTCSSYGTRLETCSKCNEMRETGLPQLECTNLRTEYRKETCGEYGYTKEICNDCNTTISTVKVAPTGQHVYATDDVDDVIEMCEAYYGTYGGLGKYRTNTENEWVVDYCVNCFEADFDAMYLPYTEYEIAEIMLGYVNELRESVLGHSRYNLVIDETLLELAQIRAKEISIIFSHYEGATMTYAGENIATGRGIRGHFESWCESKGHYLNMITEEYQYFAYAIYRAETGISYGVQLFWNDSAKSSYTDELRYMYYEKFGEFPSSGDPTLGDTHKLWEKIFGEE